MKKQLIKIYKHKWFPRLFYKASDGGKDSGVTAYFLIEWKILFSIGVLHFKKGSREAYHTHAFNALTWWLRGSVTEERVGLFSFLLKKQKDFKASIKPKFTSRENFHKIIAHVSTYALTFRGPWRDTWRDTWRELRGNKTVTLTHGRKEITNTTHSSRKPFPASFEIGEEQITSRIKTVNSKFYSQVEESKPNFIVDCLLFQGKTNLQTYLGILGWVCLIGLSIEIYRILTLL